MSATNTKKLHPLPLPPQSARPVTPTSPRGPGAWKSVPHHQHHHSLPPLPPHPKSPPPTPPVSAGLSSSLPRALSRMHLGDPPNTPATPAFAPAFSDSPVRVHSISVSSSNVESSPRRRRDQQSRERRRSSATSPHSPRVSRNFTQAEAQGVSKRRSGKGGWSSSSSEDEAANTTSRTTSRSSSRQPALHSRTDTAPAAVLRWSGVGAVVIERPLRAISARDAGGVKLVDATASPGRMNTAIKDGEMDVDEDEEMTLSEPGPGFSGRQRVKKTLTSKRMEALQMGDAPAGIIDFRERALPSTPMSVQATPKEMYHPRGERESSPSPSPSPSPARTPPSTASLPLRFPLPPSHMPARPALQPLSENERLVDSNTSPYPITPIANDLGSLSVIAGLGDLPPPTSTRRHRGSRSGSRPSRPRTSRSCTFTNASRSSSVSTTSIRLRSGSVVTVIPPEQTAWQRTTYVAGPIRLNNFDKLAQDGASMLPGLSHQQPRKAKSVASLDAFQDALENLPENPATQERRASDESVMDDLVSYFEDLGVGPLGADGDSLDCFWNPDLDEGDNRKSIASLEAEWTSPQPERAAPPPPMNFPPAPGSGSGASTPSKRMSIFSALSGSMGAVEVVEMQDVDRDSVKRTPSLLSKSSRTSNDRRSRLAGSNGQRTKLRRLMMSAGGIL